MTKRISWLLLVLGLPVMSFAADESREVAAERARITAERNRAEAVFQAEQKACYSKFSVSGCIEDAKARRSTVLGDLRRQENSLNDAERKARAADRVKELDQKQADEARRQSEAAATGEARSASREKRAQEKAAEAQKRNEKAQAKASKPAPAKPGSAPNADAPADASAASNPAPRAPLEKQPDPEESRRRYEQRQLDAQEHKAHVQQRAAEQQKKKPVNPLPVPR